MWTADVRIQAASLVCRRKQWFLPSGMDFPRKGKFKLSVPKAACVSCPMEEGESTWNKHRRKMRDREQNCAGPGAPATRNRQTAQHRAGVSALQNSFPQEGNVMLMSFWQSPWKNTTESLLVPKDSLTSLTTPLIRSEAYTPGSRSLWRLKINIQTKKGLCSYSCDESQYLAQDLFAEKEVRAV